MVSIRSISVLLTVILIMAGMNTIFFTYLNGEEEIPTRDPPVIFTGGNGTEDDPYLISNVKGLQFMNGDLDAHYVLTNDIDASETIFWDDEAGFTPIGTNYYPFIGSFDGMGYTIRDLFVNRSNTYYTGLFGYIDNAALSNFSNDDLSIRGYSYTGLIGFSRDSNLNNIRTTNSSITSYANTGGLIGSSYNSTVKECSVVNSIVNGTSSIGGLIGYIEMGSVKNCTTSVNIIGASYVGGLIGSSSTWITEMDIINFMVDNCTSEMIFEPRYPGSPWNNDYLGGFIGYSLQGLIRNCTSYGRIDRTDRNIGGFIGLCAYSTIENSKSFVDVEGNQYVGGFIGYLFNLDFNSIQGCDSHGAVNGKLHTGGFIGYAMIREYDYSIYDYVITNTNITRSRSWGDVTGGNFTGGFIGLGKGLTLADCFSYSDAHGGNNTGGLIGDGEKVNLTDCYHIGNVKGQTRVGGLIGNYSNGTIYRCYSKGNVDGYMRIGGLIGMVFDLSSPHDTILINQSYSIAHVTGSWYLGGLIGMMFTGSIVDSYSNGSLSMNTYTGGFIGYFFKGTLRRCYSAVHVPGVTYGGGFVGYRSTITLIVNCYWDRNISGKPNGAGSGSTAGITMGWTESLMKSTYYNTWDFEYTWNLVEDKTHPYLRSHYVGPLIESNDPEIAVEDQPLDIEYRTWIYYPVYGELSAQFNTNARPWLIWDPLGKNLTGTPTNDDVGSYWINISVDDETWGLAYRNVTLEVINVNDPPVIITENVLIVKEDEPFNLEYEADDIDPTMDVLTWTLETDADWLTMVGSVLQGTPDNDDVGTYNIRISVSDGNGGVDMTEYQISVQNVNDPPSILTDALPNATEDQPYSFDLTGSDQDLMDTNTWEIESGPSWIALNDGTLEGIPGNNDVGYADINISIFDSEDSNESKTFTIFVENVNDPPLWGNVPDDQQIVEEIYFSTEISVTDIDFGDDVELDITSYPPVNIQISQEGVITWALPIPGVYIVNISATDGYETIVTSFNLTVSARNNPPIIYPIPSIHIPVDEEYSVYVIAADDDGDDLTYSLNIAPDGMSINDEGRITWIPEAKDEGSQAVIVNVSDGKDYTTFHFTLTVENDDEEPDDIWSVLSIAAVVVFILIIIILLLFILVVTMVVSRKSRGGYDEGGWDEE